MDDNLGNLAVVYSRKCNERRIPFNDAVRGQLSHGGESLREINLSDILIDDTFEIVFDLLLMVTEVRTFRLSRCSITDDHIGTFVTRMCRNHSVRKLFLDGNPNITSKSASHLLELMRTKRSLIHVDLAGTAIGGNVEFISTSNFILGYNGRLVADESSSDDDFDVRKFAGTMSHIPTTASKLQQGFRNEVAHRRRSMGITLDIPIVDEVDIASPPASPRRVRLSNESILLDENFNASMRSTRSRGDNSSALSRTRSTMSFVDTALQDHLATVAPVLDDVLVVLAWYDWRRSGLLYVLFAAVCIGGDNLMLPSVPILMWYAAFKGHVATHNATVGVTPCIHPMGPLRVKLFRLAEACSSTDPLAAAERSAFLKRLSRYMDKAHRALERMCRVPTGHALSTALFASAFLYVVPLTVVVFLLGTAAFVLVPLMENGAIATDLRSFIALLMAATRTGEGGSPSAAPHTILASNTRLLKNARAVRVEIKCLLGVTLPSVTHKCSTHVHATFGSHSATTAKKDRSWDWDEEIEFEYVPNVDIVLLTVYDTAGVGEFVGAATVRLDTVALDVVVALPLVVERAHVEDEVLLKDIMKDLQEHDKRERRKYTKTRGHTVGNHGAGTPMAHVPDEEEAPIKATHLSVIVKVL